MDRVGLLQPSVYDTIYGKLAPTPANSDIGLIDKDTGRALVVWNATAHDQWLKSVEVNLPAGMSVSTYSQDYLRDGYYDHAVVRAKSELPSYVGSVKPTYCSGSVTFSVTGKSGRVWDFRHNWKSSVQCEYSYRTDIITSRSRKEQRRALRINPRFVQSTEYLLTDAEVREFHGWMATSNLTKKSRIDPVETLFLTDAYSGMTDEIPCETALGTIKPGDTIGLFAAYTGLQYHSVKDVTSDGIRIGSATGEAIPRGAPIQVIRDAFMESNPTSKHITSTVSQVVVRWLDYFNDKMPPLPAEYPLLDGVEVFTEKPNWLRPLDVTYTDDIVTLDMGRGSVRRYDPSELYGRMLKGSFTNFDRERRGKILRMFQRCKGQLREFYFPSHEPDIIVTQPVRTGDTVVRVPTASLARNFGSNGQYRAIAATVYYGDLLSIADTLTNIANRFNICAQLAPWQIEDLPKYGPYAPWQNDPKQTTYIVYVGVKSITRQGDESLITLDTPWTYSDLGEVKQVSWLFRGRFASDTIVFDDVTPEASNVELAFKTLER